MRVIWTPTRRDMAAHFDYLAARDLDIALRLEATTLRMVEGLSDYPQRGRLGGREGTRELLVPNLPYVVVSSIGEDRVTVLRMLHAAQDWPPRES